MKFIYKFLLPILFFYSTSLFAVEEFTSKADCNSTSIGSRVSITLIARSSDIIIFPQLPDSLPNCKLISKSLIDTVKSNGETQLSQKIFITSFDSGLVSIPSFTFFTSNANGMIPHYSQSISITFSALDISKMKDLRPIKSIIVEQKNWKDYWLWYAIGIAVIIIGFVVYKLLTKKKPITAINEVAKREIPKMAPEEWLRLEIEQLKQKKLWESGEQKLHFSALSDALRRYLELKFDFAAMELTTNEIEEQIVNKLSEPKHKLLSQLLNSSDLVKFAKFNPDAEFCINSLATAKEFID